MLHSWAANFKHQAQKTLWICLRQPMHSAVLAEITLNIYEEEIGKDVTSSKNRYENKVCLNFTTILLRYNILINCNRRFDCSRDCSGNCPGLPGPVSVCSESKPPWVGLEVIVPISKFIPVLSETVSVQPMCWSSNYHGIKRPIQR